MLDLENLCIIQACFDVRESSSLWQRLAFLEEISTGEEPPPEWISTHPASETRAGILDELIPEVSRDVQLLSVVSKSGLLMIP